METLFKLALNHDYTIQGGTNLPTNREKYIVPKPSLITLDKHISLQSLKAFLESDFELDTVQLPHEDSWSSSVYSPAPTTIMEDRPEIVFTHFAKAIAGYEGSLCAEHDLSFARNELLEVSLVTDTWWVARKASGEVGLAPSNFLELLPSQESERDVNGSGAESGSPVTLKESVKLVARRSRLMEKKSVVKKKVEGLHEKVKGVLVRMRRLLRCEVIENGVEPYKET